MLDKSLDIFNFAVAFWLGLPWLGLACLVLAWLGLSWLVFMLYLIDVLFLVAKSLLTKNAGKVASPKYK